MGLFNNKNNFEGSAIADVEKQHGWGNIGRHLRGLFRAVDDGAYDKLHGLASGIEDLKQRLGKKPADLSSQTSPEIIKEHLSSKNPTLRESAITRAVALDLIKTDAAVASKVISLVTDPNSSVAKTAIGALKATPTEEVIKELALAAKGAIKFGKNHKDVQNAAVDTLHEIRSTLQKDPNHANVDQLPNVRDALRWIANGNNHELAARALAGFKGTKDAGDVQMLLDKASDGGAKKELRIAALNGLVDAAVDYNDPKLVKLTNDRDKEIRAAAIATTVKGIEGVDAKTDPAKVDDLLKRLGAKETPDQVKIAILKALEGTTVNHENPLVLKSIKHKNHDIAEAAIKVVKGTNSDVVVNHIMSSLRRWNRRPDKVRLAAIESLANTTSRKGQKYLYGIARNRRLPSAHRVAAINGLNIKELKVAKDLANIVAPRPMPFRKVEETAIRQAAATKLQEMWKEPDASTTYAFIIAQLDAVFKENRYRKDKVTQNLALTAYKGCEAISAHHMAIAYFGDKDLQKAAGEVLKTASDPDILKMVGGYMSVSPGNPANKIALDILAESTGPQAAVELAKRLGAIPEIFGKDAAAYKAAMDKIKKNLEAVTDPSAMDAMRAGLRDGKPEALICGVPEIEGIAVSLLKGHVSSADTELAFCVALEKIKDPTARTEIETALRNKHLTGGAVLSKATLTTLTKDFLAPSDDGKVTAAMQSAANILEGQLSTLADADKENAFNHIAGSTSTEQAKCYGKVLKGVSNDDLEALVIDGDEAPRLAAIVALGSNISDGLKHTLVELIAQNTLVTDASDVAKASAAEAEKILGSIVENDTKGADQLTRDLRNAAKKRTSNDPMGDVIQDVAARLLAKSQNDKIKEEAAKIAADIAARRAAAKAAQDAAVAGPAA